MKIQFFCPQWGSESLAYEDFFNKAQQAGYDGVEMGIPVDSIKKKHIANCCIKTNMQLIAQQGEAGLESDFAKHKDLFLSYLNNAMDLKPLFINSQTGKDFFTEAQNLELIDAAASLSKDRGVQISHELHRGRFTYSPTSIQAYLYKRPDLNYTADFSHWLTVSESRLDAPQQQQVLNAVIPRCVHIHARIGFEQGPQVNDPSAPEWRELVDIYIAWWQKIIDTQVDNGAEQISITPEFGPGPYMPKLPHSQAPVSDQWQANVYMMNLLKNTLRCTPLSKAS
ncbi:sugar phosphate isomerase/epimerase family protein [Agaribacterium haliotis]|uniref:sugar phosphate isomerase/epimerase family protein n=1 Tax=Agaribacterium haliotis TaxID=2013869 RepID=UPI000BB5722D|nr:sugar phosphate isomerase/epimerase [Agaribacterium haliotis]